MFFGKLENGHALCMDVRTFRWFNRGEYTPNQIAKLQAFGRDLLATKEEYKRCTHIVVHEVQGVSNTEVKGAGVRR
jgi:hypothetical protein